MKSLRLGRWVMGLMLALAWSSSAWAAGDKLPSNKWYQGVKGLEEALLLQQESGADLFVYFANYGPSDQEGLCRWFEKKGIYTPEVSKFLRDYAKVQIFLPLSKKDEPAIEKYRVNKCPAVFIVSTNGYVNRCTVFDWDKRPLELLRQQELMELFRSKSGPRYQLPAKDDKKK